MTNQLTNPSRTECPPMPLSFIPPEMYSISFEQYRPKLSQYNIIQPYHMTTPTPSPMATTESSHLADEHQEQHQQLPLEMDLLQHPLQKSVSSNAIPIQPGKLKQRKRKRKNTIEKNPSIADIQTANHHAIIGPFLIHSLKTLKSSPNYPFPIIIPHDSNIVLSESNDDDIDFVKFGELASIAEVNGVIYLIFILLKQINNPFSVFLRFLHMNVIPLIDINYYIEICRFIRYH